MNSITQTAAESGAELVPVSAGEIGGSSALVVDGRALHSFLQVGRVFAAWIAERIEKYGFEEARDFDVTVSKTGKRSNVNQKDYRLTLDMAKELAMVENNEQGRRARRYFIDMERQALATAAGHGAIAYTVQPGDKLTAEEQTMLRTLVRARAEDLPVEHRKAATIAMWSRLKAHFKVEYRQIPREQLGEAVSIVTRAVLPGEEPAALPAPPKPQLRRVLMVFDTASGDVVGSQPLHEGWCMVDRNREGSLYDFVFDHLPREQLPTLLNLIAERISHGLGGATKS